MILNFLSSKLQYNNDKCITTQRNLNFYNEYIMYLTVTVFQQIEFLSLTVDK